MRLMRSAVGTQRKILHPLFALVCLTCVAPAPGAESATNMANFTPAASLQAYNLGVQLYASNHLADAYACFETVVAQPPAHPFNYFAYSAEWYLGRIHERFDHPDAAISHYKRATDILMAKVAETNEVWLIRTQLGAVDHLGEMYDRHGRMGLLYSTLQQREELLKRFQAKAGGPLDFEKYPWWWGEYWYLKVDRATVLRRVARLDESDTSMNTVVEETTRFGRLDEVPKPADMETLDVGRRIAIGNQIGALEWLSEVAMLREQMDDAVRYRDRARSLAYSQHGGGFERPVDRSRYVYTLVRREGASQKARNLMDDALKRGSSEAFEWWFQTNLANCELLVAEGKTEASLKLLDQLIEGGRTNDSLRMLPLALKQRAQLRFDLDDISGADADAKESLALYRAMGWKRLEPDLYELHGQCLARQSHFAEALQIWQDAWQMCENLKLHHRSLHMLLRMADLQLRLGNKAALEQAWTRIDSFLRAHPDLPEPTQLRLRLARLDHLKAKGDKTLLEAAYQETQRFVGNSKLTPYQSRSWTAYTLLGGIPIVSTATQFLPKVDPARSGVDLQPILTTTRVATGELAHARFSLVNPSTTTATGMVQVAPTGWRSDWTPTDQGWKITLSPDRSAIAAAKPVSLASGTATALFLEAPTAASDITNNVSVTWYGDTVLEARWQFGAVEDQRAVALVNASLAEENPFYSIAFYHELYYRGQTSRVENLRITASQPCRVELLEAATGKLLAVDASGDGNFEGAGDVLGVDADGDGYPDFTLGPEQDVARFELLVYPTVGTNPGSREIEITLWRRESGAWIADAVDTLLLK